MSTPSPEPVPSSGTPSVWAVLGGTGFIGSAVRSALAARGVEVRAVSAPRLRTDASDVAGLLAAAAALDTERRRLADAFAGADVVVNAAGLATPGAADSPELRGANSLLPALVADAADAAGVRRFVHLSSAAVQGHRPFLDESPHVEPFSAYSRSKALGEQVLSARHGGSCSVATVRATSVQGPGRATTAKLSRLAASPLASVAGPGTAPSPVSSVDSLVDFVLRVGSHTGPVPAVVLQPWEQASVSSVLEAAGGRRPAHLPVWACRLALRSGYAVSSLAGERLHGALRRVEMMWFGQRQEPGWAEATGNVPEPRVREVLAASRN
ncbi:NAD(P)-dependent oxidoreductase [Arthrobacter sp. zg-Y1171]|uniref:NAD-dependent epimerase/dehydratase family protein n=1 Tax=Arthrobacter sp. zg-Y1171 TaxID=2964610 RepID=UPI002102232D|nr:NAD-dependent epimerase/dehydratase family protein [Arthrobacter sp. zg-Y1171]MCQ1995035.1 NAD-dependent epimerase/dehydratase family protein [Arthrobacter sp. zg-Y1171]UWX80913.1 NAD-dependent epimerase/dehydratase family protein [Arthrobacter sp. zg-Y1171]